MESRKRPVVLVWVLVFLALNAWSVAAQAASRITAIDFRGVNDPNLLEIRTDGPVSFDKQDNTADRQVVIEIKGASIDSLLSRKIDTSSFNGQVLLVSPYAVQGQVDTVRVVIQLREQAEVNVTQEGNMIRASIPASGGHVSQNVEAFSDTGKKQVVSTDVTDAKAEALSSPSEKTPGAERLKEFEANREKKVFTGKPITLQVRDVEAADVFRLIGDASGFNIVLTDDVKGKLTLSLMEVPWDEALEVVLKILGLTAERNKNILRIISVKNYTQEKIDEFRAVQAANAAQPRITRIFPISYANIDDLANIITKMQVSVDSGSPEALSGIPAAGQPGSSSSATGRTIVTDKRTNSIIVRDTSENMERVKKLVDILDTQTPQVLIEGKIVEVRESFSKTLNGNLGVGLENAASPSFGSYNGGIPLDPLVGSTGSPFLDSTKISPVSAGASLLGLGFLQGNLRLNALLNMGESEDELKQIASPKIVVLNREKASILQAQPVLLNIQTVQNGVVTFSPTVQNANISLDVSPTVTNDGNVRLDLTLTRDLVANLAQNQQAVALRNIKTNVVVESGTTLVMGGIYTMESSFSDSGIPFLRKLPILGTFFGGESKKTGRNELIFFITPQILNPRKAGMGNV
jgi:type IV pilus assembly protein PilQ